MTKSTTATRIPLSPNVATQNHLRELFRRIGAQTCQRLPRGHVVRFVQARVSGERGSARARTRLAQFLEAHRAQRGHAEHCAVFCSGSCDGTFTLMVEKTLQGGSRAIDRKSELLAHDGDGEIDFLYTAQDVGHEVTGLEGLRVAPVGRFVFGRAVDVIEDWAGQPSLGETSEIMKVVTLAQMHACSDPQIDRIAFDPRHAGPNCRISNWREPIRRVTERFYSRKTRSIAATIGRDVAALVAASWAVFRFMSLASHRAGECNREWQLRDAKAQETMPAWRHAYQVAPLIASFVVCAISSSYHSE
jgi:hypothetical protein